jgi:hypothetical protein
VAWQGACVTTAGAGLAPTGSTPSHWLKPGGSGVGGGDACLCGASMPIAICCAPEHLVHDQEQEQEQEQEQQQEQHMLHINMIQRTCGAVCAPDAAALAHPDGWVPAGGPTRHAMPYVAWSGVHGERGGWGLWSCQGTLGRKGTCLLATECGLLNGHGTCGCAHPHAAACRAYVCVHTCSCFQTSIRTVDLYCAHPPSQGCMCV